MMRTYKQTPWIETQQMHGGGRGVQWAPTYRGNKYMWAPTEDTHASLPAFTGESRVRRACRCDLGAPYVGLKLFILRICRFVTSRSETLTSALWKYFVFIPNYLIIIHRSLGDHVVAREPVWFPLDHTKSKFVKNTPGKWKDFFQHSGSKSSNGSCML